MIGGLLLLVLTEAQAVLALTADDLTVVAVHQNRHCVLVLQKQPQQT